MRRRFYEIQAASPAPIAAEALVRIGALYAIEADIRGCSAEQRQRVRFSRSKPLVDALKPWFELQLATVSGKSTTAEAIRYVLTRWDGLTRFLDDGRVEKDQTSLSVPSVPLRSVSYCASPHQVSVNIGMVLSSATRHGRPFRATAALTVSDIRSSARI